MLVISLCIGNRVGEVVADGRNRSAEEITFEAEGEVLEAVWMNWVWLR